MSEVTLTTNVTTKERMYEEVIATMDFLSETLSMTLGPYGSTTIIQDRNLQHFMTKDGYNVLRKIFIKEDLPRTILDMIKRISGTLVRTVGDGSTSSVIISTKLFKELLKLLKKHGVPPQDLVNLLNKSAQIFDREIRKYATPIGDDMKELARIATISANNDPQVGELIREVFTKIGRYGHVNIENGESPGDRYKITPGYEIPRGHINYLFATNEDGRTAEYSDVMVFMANETLREEDIPMLAELVNDVCIKFDKPLVFVAKAYDPSVKTFFHINKLNNKKLPIVAVDMAMESVDHYEKFEDLAISLGCQFYDKRADEKLSKFPTERLGHCRRFVSDDMRTKFVEGGGNPKDIKARIAYIKEKHDKMAAIEDHIERDYILHDMKKRISSLSESMATIYVGGATHAERETRMFLIEDAVYACQSALENGYIIGGNLILPIILTHAQSRMDIIKELEAEYDNKEFILEFLDTLKESFLYSYQLVLRNAGIEDPKAEAEKCVKNRSIYNLKTNKLETLEETEVINSAETDIEIIKACFSIIGLLVTSNQFISLNTPFK